MNDAASETKQSEFSTRNCERAESKRHYIYARSNPLAPGNLDNQSSTGIMRTCALWHNRVMAATAIEPIELPAATRAILAKTATELKLTHKQLALSYLLVAGVPQTEAYRRVYDGDPHSPYLYSTASTLANHPKVVATVEAGRTTLNHLRAERGREWREKIDEVLWEVASDPAAKPGDRVQAVKTAGTLRHVQAFAAVSADKALTDLSEAISCFTNELETAGIQPIDVTYTVSCSESQQNLKSVRYLPLVDDDDLADCIPGAD